MAPTAFWTPVYHDDYPPTTTFATVLVKGGTVITVAGVPFEVHDIGPGECETASLWVSGDVAFVGDLVYSHAHPWLFEARTATWLDQLARVRPLLVGKTLYVGHGATGTVELLDAQAEYIRMYQNAVIELALAMAPHGGTLHRLVGGWRQPALPLQGGKSQPARRVAPRRGHQPETPRLPRPYLQAGEVEVATGLSMTGASCERAKRPKVAL